MAKKIGFIGLGIMGQGMSANILKGGYGLTVYNRTREKTRPLEEAGAAVATTPQEIGERNDIVILMLTGPDAVDEILYGRQGLFTGESRFSTLINMSTVSPEYSRHLNEALKAGGITFIDAPVAGTKEPAEEGTLVIFAGGPQKKVEELEPLLLMMGKKVLYCGEVGKASALKMVFNLLLGSMVESLCEALTLGERCGFSREFMLDTIQAGPLGCGLFGYKADKLKAGEYPVQFPLRHMAKDIRMALKTGDETGAAMPVGHTLYQLYRQGVGHGFGDEDFAAVKKVLEAMSDRPEE